MKVVFLGTPDFGVPAMKNILASQRHQLVATVCQPDRVGSRGKVVLPAVKQFSLENGIPCYQFEKVSRDGVETLKSLAPDIMVTAAYGQILSDEVIAIAPHGIINIHGSLLPKLRGAAPIQYAVWKGEKQTGVTILNTVRKVDAGEMILKEALDIGDDETSGELFERLAELGGKLIVRALDAIEDGTAIYTPQNEDEVTFSAKISVDDEKIDWNKSAKEVHDLVRALNPNPVAWTTLCGKRLKIFRTRTSTCRLEGEVGQVVEVNKKYFSVACAKGVVDVLEVQPENGKKMDSASFLNGNKLSKGDFLGK